MATTYMMHQGGKLYYGLAANPATTDASTQVTSFRENPSAETVRVPATLSQAGFDKVVNTISSVDVEFLDDSDATGDGGFFEFLATQNTGVVYLVWQPTSSATPKAAYKVTAVRPQRGGNARNPMLCSVTLPVETVTDTFPT
jgi:hypothetical protein